MSSLPDTDALTEYLLDEVGSSLRFVGAYRGDFIASTRKKRTNEIEFSYMNEETREEYSSERAQEVLDNLVLSTFTMEYHEEVEPFGEFEFGALFYDDVTLFHLVVDDAVGVIVTFDADELVITKSLIDDCHSILEESVARETR